MNDNGNDNVVVANVITNRDLPPDRLLAAAIGRLDRVIIIGYDKDGEEYFASSVADGGDCLWHLERAKLKLLRQAD